MSPKHLSLTLKKICAVIKLNVIIIIIVYSLPIYSYINLALTFGMETVYSKCHTKFPDHK